MSVESENLRATFSDRLANFEDTLAGTADEVRMLAGIREAIGRLIEANGGNEAEIRRVLEERYKSGALREETFQLVQSMLDRYVTEQVPTSDSDAGTPNYDGPAAGPGGLEQPANDDPFGRTDVITTDALEAADGDDRAQVGSVLRDRFVLQERVSGGSMGVVYKALDRRLAEAGSPDPWVAIKVLSPRLARNSQALRALQQEAAKSRCLTHSHIVRFIDFDRDEDLCYIVMEWLDGRTLADILDSPDSRSIDQDTAFRIVRQVGKALEYAHRCGIVHADVKPGNVMILPNGDAKLFDFGVARVQQRQRADADDFDPGVLGAVTPAYSSMQVLTGEDPVPADDVFSLACLLYRLVAGYRVFGPRNAAEAAEAGMAPQRLEGISDEQWSAVKKALSYARVTRFDSIGGFLEALGYRPADSSVAPDVTDHVQFDDSSGSAKWVVALVALLSLLGVASYQFGIVDEALRRLDLAPAETRVIPSPTVDSTPPVAIEEGGVESLQTEVTDASPTVTATEAAKSEEASPDTSVVAADNTRAESPAAAAGDDGTPAETRLEMVDFVEVATPDAAIMIDPGAFEAPSHSVTLREDGRPVIVEFRRAEPLDEPLSLRLEEVGFSGNRSPWRTGQFEIPHAGYVEFAAGQARARIALAMASDERREADQVSTLSVRETEAAALPLARIELVLEDDDQRRFESSLPANTVAFAVSQVSVRERDPAVQIDLVRFNPDATRLVVATEVLDVTAARGEDFFPPGNGFVVFGPGQRSARMLIPLVQDVEAEGDEAFVVEIRTESKTQEDGVHERIAVIIRDDD